MKRVFRRILQLFGCIITVPLAMTPFGLWSNLYFTSSDILPTFARYAGSAAFGGASIAMGVLVAVATIKGIGAMLPSGWR